MATIYIHIPFCKKACHYCDFHFSTNHSYQQEMVSAISLEIESRKSETSELISSIYFGGGTPSLLSETQLKSLLNSVYNNYSVEQNVEITLEANPDDLSKDYLKMLFDVGVNRLSIGIQSFQDEFLTFMNRAHNAYEANICIQNALETGFTNITVDCIYGIPHKNHDLFLKDLETFVNLGVHHISAYALTIEPKTVFGKRTQNGLMPTIDEDFTAIQFEKLVEFFSLNGYEQYEISNFAKHETYSKHNSNYWKKGKYLGFGPSAHSYNGVIRKYSIANNAKYLKAVQSNSLTFEVEELTEIDHYNEYLLTSLRTKWGFSTEIAFTDFGVNVLSNYKLILDDLVKNQFIVIDNGIIYLTMKGKLIADHITEKLMIV